MAFIYNIKDFKIFYFTLAIKTLTVNKKNIALKTFNEEDQEVQDIQLKLQNVSCEDKEEKIEKIRKIMIDGAVYQHNQHNNANSFQYASKNENDLEGEKFECFDF